MPEKVFDKVSRVATEAVLYDGTAEGLTRVCQMVGVLPALGRIESDGATVIYVGQDMSILLADRYVVAAKPGQSRREKDYSGGMYSPDDFEQRFVRCEES